MKSSVKSPSSIEKQPDLPEDWKPPSRFHVRVCFTVICYFSIGKPNLEELWQEVREQGWKKRNRLFRHQVLRFLCMQGATFFIYFMLMTNPPRVHVSTVHYDMLVALSFTCSLKGPFYHFLFWKSDADIEMHERINQGKPFQLSRRKVLIHISLVRLANLAAMGSWGISRRRFDFDCSGR
ncbi:uncharacterized protein F5147DRAFT_108396 [Suillus discolor]|uniref:Uncharacterized protein n=1 Tax=Suillus discolor TaxID=1912936 RepID=A0A9P7F9V3_9AGAM|nr:uncharacterized protein F5147DRAFT_108396 [Suillus discolor]KAG2110933.1 hypothetical protein F5147DRAFT_108396 [Suillus discolor]